MDVDAILEKPKGFISAHCVALELSGVATMHTSICKVSYDGLSVLVARTYIKDIKIDGSLESGFCTIGWCDTCFVLSTTGTCLILTM